MPETTIPFADVCAAVVRLAEERPEHVDETSLYFDQAGRPCCIFGHAFAAMGMTAGEVMQATSSCDDDYSIDSLDLEGLGIGEPSVNQMNWARTVQRFQDSGRAWATALRDAGQVPA